MSEISEHRLPRSELINELDAISSLPNVEIHTGERVCACELRKTGKYAAVIIGAGKQQAIPLPCEIQNFDSNPDYVYDSKRFLRLVNNAYKLTEADGVTSEQRAEAIAKLETLVKGKRVVVLGAGNTADDCCQVANRLGASHVSIAFRKEMRDMRASRTGITALLAAGVDFVPLSEPVAIDAKNNTITFARNRLENGKYIRVEGVTEDFKADFVISAFGTEVPKEHTALANRKARCSKTGRIEGPQEDVTEEHYCCENGVCEFKPMCNLYTGGDFAGSASVVEAVNDGRVVASAIYEEITGEDYKPELTVFHTPVDEVDISTTMCNGKLKMMNPFSISSAPISLTYEHLKRAYQAGFGVVVTKTIPLTKDVHVENALRIFKVDGTKRGDQSYVNNCMISDAGMEEYWVDVIRKLKAEFPDRLLIASIMASDVKEDWEKLAKLAQEAGADALEMNLSCPNSCASGSCVEDFADKSKAMAMAIGQDLQAIERVTRYVVEACTIPVFVKLTPNTVAGHIDDHAEAARRGGAHGVSYSNTVSALAKIFPNGLPYPQVGRNRSNIPSMGYSGSAIRPIVLAGLAKISARFNKEQLSIMGIGGVEDANTALQHIHAGAEMVQVCSAVQTYSYEIVQEMIYGLKFFLYCNTTPRLRAYLENFGEQSFMPAVTEEEKKWWTLSSKQDAPCPRVADRVALVNKHLCGREYIQHPCPNINGETWFAKAFINTEKCTGCLACQTSCRDNAGHAIVRLDDGSVKVNEDWCIGCALCSTVCPSSAIEMREVPAPADGKIKYRFH